MDSEFMQKIGIKEIFLPIDKFPNYEVSNYGNVRNIKTGNTLKFWMNGDGYYSIMMYTNYNKRSSKQVHRLVLHTFENNNENKQLVDHIDSNRLNNCLFNLRFATRQENSSNRQNSKNNTSGVKGISYRKDNNRWRARIMFNGKPIDLGTFDSLEDAKIARQKKAKELYGEFVNKCEL